MDEIGGAVQRVHQPDPARFGYDPAPLLGHHRVSGPSVGEHPTYRPLRPVVGLRDRVGVRLEMNARVSASSRPHFGGAGAG